MKNQNFIKTLTRERKSASTLWHNYNFSDNFKFRSDTKLIDYWAPHFRQILYSEELLLKVCVWQYVFKRKRYAKKVSAENVDELKFKIKLFLIAFLIKITIFNVWNTRIMHITFCTLWIKAFQYARHKKKFFIFSNVLFYLCFGEGKCWWEIEEWATFSFHSNLSSFKLLEIQKDLNIDLYTNLGAHRRESFW